MARQFKLPVARLVQPVLDDGEVFAIAQNERLLLVDLDALRRTKSFAKLKAQAATWTDAACEEYLLAMMAEGPL